MGTGYNNFSTRWRVAYSPEEYGTLDSLCFYAEYTGSVASNSVATLGISVPTNYAPKGRFMEEATGPVIIRVKEGATFTGGSAINAINLSRNSSNVDHITFVSNPTVTDEGSTLITEVEGSGSQTSSAPGFSSRTHIELKLDTKYAITVTNGGASAVNFKVGLYFIERPT